MNTMTYLLTIHDEDGNIESKSTVMSHKDLLNMFPTWLEMANELGHDYYLMVTQTQTKEG